jgi:hypothetical protein
MAETIERVKADDPRELKKQISDLKKQLLAEVSNRGNKITAPDTQRVEVLTDADRELLKTLAGEFSTFSEDITARGRRDVGQPGGTGEGHNRRGARTLVR